MTTTTDTTGATTMDEIALTETELRTLARTWVDTGPTEDGPCWASYMDAVFGALAAKRNAPEQAVARLVEFYEQRVRSNPPEIWRLVAENATDEVYWEMRDTAVELGIDLGEREDGELPPMIEGLIDDAIFKMQRRLAADPEVRALAGTTSDREL